MQSIMNFLPSSTLYALKRAGRVMSGERGWAWMRPDGKPAVCDWMDEAVRNFDGEAIPEVYTT